MTINSPISFRHLGLFFLSCLLITGVIYYPSFAVPFYLDDYRSIVENQALMNGDFYQYVVNRRAIPHLSIWIDYQLWGNEPTFFHVQNIMLHILNALLVFVLVNQLVQLATGKQQLWLAVFVALVWLVHPLNSQPVIYIVQRMTLWVAFFSLLALISWLKFRTTSSKKPLYFIAAGVFTFGALFSKETAVTLPLLFVLADLVIVKVPRKQLLKEYAIVAAIGLAIAVVLFAVGKISFASLDAMTREHPEMTRWGYFWAQQEIVALYLYKFFVPWPLFLEYPFYQEASFASAWLWFLLHVAIVGTAVALVRHAPLVTFGVLFYYICHLVESSFIPITDLAFEHRNYLPNVGFTLAIGWLLSAALRSVDRQGVIALAVIVVVGFSTLTTFRALQWQNQLAFYQREIQHHPEIPRLHYNVGYIYVNRGDLQSAEAYFRQAFFIAWQQDRVTIQVISGIMEIFFLRNDFDSLQRLFMELEQSFMDNAPWRSRLYSILSMLYINAGHCDIAADYLAAALEIDPENSQAHQLIAQCAAQP